jgi:hypothetical protein
VAEITYLIARRKERERERERENERERETWYNIQRHTPVTYYLQLGPTTYLFYYLLK